MHGKKYQEAAKLIEPKKAYPINEAIELAKKTSIGKFDGSLELHVRVGIDPAKGDQQIRATISLPNGTGKSKKIAVFTNKVEEAKKAGAEIVGGLELIDEIKKSGKCDFEVAIADMEMMKPLATIAKILGPKGLMPSPKNETVTNNILQAIADQKKGKVTIKNDDTCNIHLAFGKISFDSAKLLENFNAVMEAIRKAKPASSKGVYLRNISIASTMGPGIKVSL